MSDSALIEYCSPTLAGLKTGSLFTVACGDKDILLKEIAQMSVAQLVARLRAAGEFPHEIGLFLGYPPEDVEGFIAHRDDGCKYVGTWRVYGDEVSARKKFADYRMCTISYERQFSRGKKLLDLIVAT